MSDNGRMWSAHGLAVVAIVGIATASVASQRAVAVQTAHADEFFIVSSVDSAKNQLLLKRPTEVTEVMRVDAATRFLDEDGKALKFSDLRAGDTVYIQSKAGTGGSIAVEIRKGPMTTTELRRRYLQPKK